MDTAITQPTPALEGEQTILPTEMGSPPERKPRGFAAMPPAARSAISAKGGKAAQLGGRAHRFSSEEGRAAGKMGGAAPHVSRGRRPAGPARPVQTTLPAAG